MATYVISRPGTSTSEEEACWRLTLGQAEAAMFWLDCRKGSYWARTLLRAYRHAKRTKTQTVSVCTDGVRTGELSNILAACGCTVSQDSRD